MSYNFESIVKRSEVQSLKEMIFNRVKERTNTDSNEFQKEMMNVARDSFVSKGNPFSDIANYEPKDKVEKVAETSVKSNDSQVGFSQRITKSQEEKVEAQNKVLQESIASKTIMDNMLEAKKDLYNKQSFMGALNFLNSQAAVSLIKTRTNRLEFLA